MKRLLLSLQVSRRWKHRMHYVPAAGMRCLTCTGVIGKLGRIAFGFIRGIWGGLLNVTARLNAFPGSSPLNTCRSSAQTRSALFTWPRRVIQEPKLLCGGLLATSKYLPTYHAPPDESAISKRPSRVLRSSRFNLGPSPSVLATTIAHVPNISSAPVRMPRCLRSQSGSNKNPLVLYSASLHHVSGR
jgi:hypothetical protein